SGLVGARAVSAGAAGGGAGCGVGGLAGGLAVAAAAGPDGNANPAALPRRRSALGALAMVLAADPCAGSDGDHRNGDLRAHRRRWLCEPDLSAVGAPGSGARGWAGRAGL